MKEVGDGEDGFDGGGVGAGVQACLVGAVDLGASRQGSSQLFVHSPAARRDEVRTAMGTHGFTEQPFRFDPRGVRVSCVDPAG